jgi:hypothetical protein
MLQTKMGSGSSAVTTEGSGPLTRGPGESSVVTGGLMSLGLRVSGPLPSIVTAEGHRSQKWKLSNKSKKNLQ